MSIKMSPSLYHFAILSGSARPTGNGSGLAHWTKAQLESYFSSSSLEGKVTLLEPNTYPFPLGPVQDAVIAAAQTMSQDVNESMSYSSPKTTAWSNIVRSLDGLIIVTPQYNWGYPSTVKEALDHLYHEWKDLPVSVISFGSRGGTKVAESLQIILEHGLKMKLVSCGQAMIALPGEYIRGEERVSGNDDFLKPYEDKLVTLFSQMVVAANERRALS